MKDLTVKQSLIIHDPRMEPKAGDILRKWERNFLVTRHDQGCVYTEPPISHKGWVGLLFFREWASSANVVYAETEVPA